MTNWIEQKAARARTQTEAAENILARGRETVDQLEAIVRRDVEKWNANFRHKIESVTKSPQGGAFKLRKTSFPSATVDAAFVSSSSSIQVETTRRRAIGDGVQTLKSEFYLKPAANGGVSLVSQAGDIVSLEYISRVLLETILEGSSDSRKLSGKV